MQTSSNEQEQLARGMAALGIAAEDAAIDHLIRYCGLLRQWNRTYNLVSASGLADLTVRHLLDSLSVKAYLLPGRLLDVGSGAGLPGLPLAIVDPGLDCALLDSGGKKIRFLKHVKRSLNIANMRVLHMRVEDLENGDRFDNIISRAFASLLKFATAVRHLSGAGTRLLAMKGKYPEDELQALPAWLKVDSVEKLDVPDLHAERHLVMMSVPGACRT